MRIILKFWECAKSLDFSFFHYNNLVGKMKKINGMGYQDASLIADHALKYVLEYFFADVSVECWDWVIHQINVCVSIDSSSKTDSSFLATWKVYSLFAYLCLVSCRQNLKVTSQLALADSLCISLWVERKTKQYIISDRLVLNPRALLNKSHGPSDLYRLILDLKVRAKKLKFESVEFFACSLVLEPSKLVNSLRWNINHVAYESLQETRLARAYITDDGNKLTLLDSHLNLFKSNKLGQLF